MSKWYYYKFNEDAKNRLSTGDFLTDDDIQALCNRYTIAILTITAPRVRGEQYSLVLKAPLSNTQPTTGYVVYNENNVHFESVRFGDHASLSYDSIQLLIKSMYDKGDEVIFEGKRYKVIQSDVENSKYYLTDKYDKAKTLNDYKSYVLAPFAMISIDTSVFTGYTQ